MIEFLDGMPTGSLIAISDKSADINTTIFKEWLKLHLQQG